MAFPIFAFIALLIISCFFLGLIGVPVKYYLVNKKKDTTEEETNENVQDENDKTVSSDNDETLVIKIPKKFFVIERKKNEIIIKHRDDEKNEKVVFKNEFLGQVYTKDDHEENDNTTEKLGFRRNTFLGQSYRPKKVPIEDMLEGYYCETCTIEEGAAKVFPNKDHCTQHMLKTHY